MVSTSGHEGMVGDLVLKGRRGDAEEHIARLKKAFGDDLFIEVKFSEIDEQKRLNEFLLVMANKHDIMVIMDNDVHYALPEGADLQDTVYCIGQNGMPLKKARLFERRNLFYPNRRNYMDFNKKFEYFYPEKVVESFLDNSLVLAERCNFDFEVGVEKYPKYGPTEDVITYFGTDVPEEIIYKLAPAKLKQKIKEREVREGKKMPPEERKKYFERLGYELDVIRDKKMLDYFLVNWEIIRDYRKKGYEIGAGRGSAAGSLLSWALDITKIDPIKFGLYFERFLNPTRNSPPDIDIDWMSGTDHIVDEFLFEKYGKERVFPVGTFSTFNEKGCLKDVVRAHYGSEGTGEGSDVNQITKEMPKMFGKSKYPLLGKYDFNLREWFEEYPNTDMCSPTVKRWIEDPKNKVIIDQTLRLQGEVRGFGKHAAGIVITPKESWYDLPTSMIAKQETIVTAFQEADGSSKDLSLLGILKLDRLKLSTLNIVMDAVRMVKENHGIDITETILHIDEHFDDKNLYAELRLGMNHGIFQFESAGINALIKGINIDNFDEVVAANALYRPGPMNIGAHAEYIHNKFSPEEAKAVHHALEPILSETNGVMIFQEQVQFIAKEIGGMSLGEGDMLRRYMDKASDLLGKVARGDELDEKEQSSKDYQSFLKYWNKFIDGAKANGYNESDVNVIKDYMVKYLGYSFNKSHSVSYGFVAMQTLYLKHYYPSEFYTALLNNVKSIGDKEKEQEWMENTIASAIAKGITVKTPSRDSAWQSSCTKDKVINIGFSMINGFGEAAYHELMELLQLKKKRFNEISMTGFFELQFSKFNKSAFNALLKAGVFDDWSTSREYLLFLKSKKKKKVADPMQMSAFDMEEISIGSRIDDAKYQPTTDGEKLEQFIEVCSFDLSHIERVANIKTKIEERARKSHKLIEPITSYTDPGWYYFFLNDIRHLRTKTNKDYIQLSMGDGISKVNVSVFDPLLGRIMPELERNAVYMAQFSKNEKNYLNMNRNTKFKKIVPAYGSELIA
jgi:DNA polymerase-3 subunit alpha